MSIGFRNFLSIWITSWVTAALKFAHLFNLIFSSTSFSSATTAEAVISLFKWNSLLKSLICKLAHAFIPRIDLITLTKLPLPLLPRDDIKNTALSNFTPGRIAADMILINRFCISSSLFASSSNHDITSNVYSSFSLYIIGLSAFAL